MSDSGAARHAFSAAGKLRRVGSALNSANPAAAVPTAGMVGAADDEVSAAVVSLFCGHAQAHQGLSAQASAFHTMFTQALTSTGASAAGVDAVSAAEVRRRQHDLLQEVN